MSREEDNEAKALSRFTEETRDHVMTVLRDDGLYRHLKFSAPGTNMYRFDLVTWPGYLAVIGDIEDHLFMRIEDMFKFFVHEQHEPRRINPHYWSEKLQGRDGRRSVQVFAEAIYRERVQEWLDEQAEEDDPEANFPDRLEVGLRHYALGVAVEDQLLYEPPRDEREAIERLREFDHDGHTIYEPYEWSMTEYNAHFLWICWAIVWGIEQYGAA